MPELLEVEYFRRLAERCAGRTILHIDRAGRPRARRRAQPPFPPAGGRRASHRARPSAREAPGARDRWARPRSALRHDGGLVVDGELAIDRLLYSPGTFGTAWVRFGIRFDEGNSCSTTRVASGASSLDPDESRMGPDAMAVTTAELGRALATRGPAPGPALKGPPASTSRRSPASATSWATRSSGAPRSPRRARLALWRRPSCAGSTATWWPRWRTSSSAAAPTPVTHGRASSRRPCPKDGSPLERSTVGGRTTWWCPRHQH